MVPRLMAHGLRHAVYDAHRTAHSLGRMVYGAQFTAARSTAIDLRAIAKGPHFIQSLPRQEKAIF
jgi:hypothetical protein